MLRPQCIINLAKTWVAKSWNKEQENFHLSIITDDLPEVLKQSNNVLPLELIDVYPAL